MGNLISHLWISSCMYICFLDFQLLGDEQILSIWKRFVVKKLKKKNNLFVNHFIVAVMGGEARVEVVSGKGCSRLFSSSFRGLQPLEPMSFVSSSPQVRSTAPFNGLVICVTGLSKGICSFVYYSLFSSFIQWILFHYFYLFFNFAQLFVCGNQLLQTSHWLKYTKMFSYNDVILWICVLTEARNQVMEATERLGGQYSPNLHPQCTHLVVQISFPPKIIWTSLHNTTSDPIYNRKI